MVRPYLQKSGERPRLGNEMFWIQGNESKQDTDNLEVNLYLLCVYATYNY